MESDFESRIDEVDWSIFHTAYGPADKVDVAGSLKHLMSDDQKLALKASHDLWCGLCHQHSYLSSAALPAYAFLVEALKAADDGLKVEILDIIAGFAATGPFDRSYRGPVGWHKKLRRRMLLDRAFFAVLTDNENKDIAYYAKMTLDGLAHNTPGYFNGGWFALDRYPSSVSFLLMIAILMLPIGLAGLFGGSDNWIKGAIAIALSGICVFFAFRILMREDGND